VDFNCCEIECDRTSDDDFKSSADLPAKRSKLSLEKGKAKKSASERFSKNVTIKKLDSILKGYCKCPSFLKTPKPEVLSFVNRTHREDGEAYPPKTLKLPDVVFTAAVHAEE